ncbi:MAG TPA: response regulator [Pelobium sp.]|nr:response regulator [Pelobium sp.]
MEKANNFPDKLAVLVIEDNQGDYVLIEDYLLEKFKKIRIKQYSDYASSVDYLQNDSHDISVILLDLHLPDMRGIDLIYNVLSLKLHIPVIVLTGYSDLSMAKSSLQMGIYDFLVKDEINAEILQKTIIYTLNRRNFITQLEEAKVSYENLFNFSPQPMWLIDSSSFKFLNANFAALSKYRYSMGELLTKSFLELHPKIEATAVKQKLLFETGKISDNHFTHVLKNGQEIKVEIHINKIDGPSGDGDALIVLSNDITETLKHINIIQDQNDRLKNIAWTQSHVVRTPLSRILGIINLIDAQGGGGEDLPFLLEQLRVSSNEMDDVVKEIVRETVGITKL